MKAQSGRVARRLARAHVTFMADTRLGYTTQTRCVDHCPKRVRKALQRHFRTGRPLPRQIVYRIKRHRPEVSCPECVADRLRPIVYPDD